VLVIDPGWLVIAMLLISGGLTGWMVTGWLMYRFVPQPCVHRMEPFDGVYRGGPTPAGDPPIPPLFLKETVGNVSITPGSAQLFGPNEVRALAMRTRLDQLKRDEIRVQTWAGEVIAVLHDNYRGIANINGQAVLVDTDTGTAVDVTGRQMGRVVAARRGGESVVIQTDRPIIESQCKALERAWREASDA
jgi:hypothetical protein